MVLARRANHDFLIQATQIAKQLPGVPRKVVVEPGGRSIARGFIIPSPRVDMTAKLNDDGLPEAMHIRISGQSILHALRAPLGEPQIDQAVFPSAGAREGEHAFDVWHRPFFSLTMPCATRICDRGFLRGVNINQNVFYLESFLDELAAKAVTDPLEYRRKLLTQAPKALAVLERGQRRMRVGVARLLPAAV